MLNLFSNQVGTVLCGRGGKHAHQIFFINVDYEEVVNSFQPILIITIASENIIYRIRPLSRIFSLCIVKAHPV